MLSLCVMHKEIQLLKLLQVVVLSRFVAAPLLIAASHVCPIVVLVVIVVLVISSFYCWMSANAASRFADSQLLVFTANVVGYVLHQIVALLSGWCLLFWLDFYDSSSCCVLQYVVAIASNLWVYQLIAISVPLIVSVLWCELILAMICSNATRDVICHQP